MNQKALEEDPVCPMRRKNKSTDRKKIPLLTKVSIMLFFMENHKDLMKQKI